MSKYATASKPLLGTTGKVVTTHEGGVGYAREPRAELFITAVSSLMKSTFYETEAAREGRLTQLAREVGIEDLDWTIRFVTWLRNEANMRSVAVVVACQAVKGRLDKGLVGNRPLIAAAIKRADEPAEVIAYWQARFGRNLPMPVKRGVADAVRRAYTERSALRYDGQSGGMRLGDVVELVHPKPAADWQSALFGYLLDRRHGRRETPMNDVERLPQVAARIRLNQMPVSERHDFARRVIAGDVEAQGVWVRALAGQWEWGKSWLGQEAEDTTFERVSEADQWALFIAHGMGYMALLRNLRNFDQAGISTQAQTHVEGVLGSQEEVERSMQFPFRFYNAYKATQGNHWQTALNLGLHFSLANVPSLVGRTLILVDMSGSMWPYGYAQEKGKTYNYELAALFGTALAMRAEGADLVEYGTSSQRVDLEPGRGVLWNMGKFHNLGGTMTASAVRQWFRPGEHERLIIITDEQAHYDPLGGVDASVPPETPVYTWNLGGYRAAHLDAVPNRHTFAGLTDTAWGLIPLIEAGATQEWPF